MRDQYCPRDQAFFFRERTPKDISSLKELADVFTASRSAVEIRDQIKDRDSRPSPSFSRLLREPAKCHLCDKVGHTASNCPTGKPRPYLNSRPWIPCMEHCGECLSSCR